jgi:N-acetylmuramoyl-L-alanine amidase
MEGQGVKPKCVWGLRVPKGVAGVIGKLPWGRFAAVTIAVGCLGAVGATGAAAAGGGVLKVRLGGDQTETRIVIDLDRAASGKLANDPGAPRQVVLNLPGVNVDGDLQGSGLGLVKAWTVERTATGARLHLDLSADASVKRRFLLPPADGVANYRYVLDLGSSAPVRPVAPPVQRIAGADTVTLISMPAQQAQQQIRKPISLRKVVIIDAGHGGKDPGAQGAAGTEKDVTLAAARALKARLEKSGRYRVVMTRESDAYVPLDTRVQIARHADADLFISLHADSGPDANTRGASVYTLADRASGRSAKFVSKDDWFMKASAPGDRGVSGILFDLTQRATHNRSASFAEMLLDRVADQQPLLRRSHREAGLAVLLAPDVPAVLLEMGFITSPEDEAILGDPAGRARLMGAVADTIDAYFAQETKLASR